MDTRTSGAVNDLPYGKRYFWGSNPCETGLAFDSQLLWSGDYCRLEYVVYQVK
jgi:hypothetical protein